MNMDAYKKYILTTSLYAAFAIIALIFAVTFFSQKRWLLVILSLLGAYVAIDNTFCGLHAKTCSRGITTHYVLPWRVNKK